jgi:Trypsin-like peptidase domain
MRSVAIILCLVLALAACGQPAGSVGAPSRRVQLADNPFDVPVAASVNPDPRVGAIFLGGFDVHTCTGSVVHSSSGDLILTAAHCMAKQFTAVFVPGFAHTAVPTNVWTVDAVYLDPLWVAFKDPRVDYAFARVSRPTGGSIEAAVGSALSLGTAPAPGSQISVIGYPAQVGGTPIGCQNSTGMNPLGFPSFWCKGLVDGTSGSPWISGSTVTGVTGGLQRGGCTQWVSYSAPFNERTAALLARAEAGGRGEAPPLAFLGC